MEHTHDGFVTFMVLVLVVLAVAWWKGWDQLLLQRLTALVDSGNAKKVELQQRVDTAKMQLQNYNASITTELNH